MKVLLVGGGAREHAIAIALRRNPATKVVGVMKSRNPGVSRLASDVFVCDEKKTPEVVSYAKKQAVDFVVIGPEGPLAAGLTDALVAAGIRVAAPTRAAAEIETSKRFMRELLTRHKIEGNIRAASFDSAEAAKAHLREYGIDVALKPVGLTGGKGVRVYGDHFTDVAGANEYIDEVFQEKIGGPGLVIEERLQGEEYTIQCLTDGARVAPLVAVQDHKRLLEGDQGPNTGGMGSYSQPDGLLPFLSKAVADASVEIVRAIVAALSKEGRRYVGPIYGQFMLTKSGPKVIEVNARFGDPEAVNVLHVLDTDYSQLVEQMATNTLPAAAPHSRRAATVVKYVVPEGYGKKVRSGIQIMVNEAGMAKAGGQLRFANVETAGPGTYRCGTSRALAVLGEGPTLDAANASCEAALKHVKGDRLYVRHDIGTRALLERRVQHMQVLRGS